MNTKVKFGLKTVQRCMAVCIGLAASYGAIAGEVEVRKSIEALYPTAKISGISPTPMKGLVEVTIGQEVIYAEENGKFLVFGPLIDAGAKKNLTEVTKERLSKIDFKDLPLELAIKTVKGDGSRTFASFEDPNCGYCKKLHQGMKSLDNYTMYTFLTPILSEDSKSKSKAIWCASDKSAAFANFMNQNTIIPTTGACEAPIGKLLDLASRLGVKGTPTLFFGDGKRVGGYLSEKELDSTLNSNGTVKLAKN